jgi:hypothetical protein
LRLSIPVQAPPNEPSTEKVEKETSEHTESTDRLERIFDLLEDHKEALGISYYSISQPALEDVFLDVLSRNRDLEDE